MKRSYLADLVESSVPPPEDVVMEWRRQLRSMMRKGKETVFYRKLATALDRVESVGTNFSRAVISIPYEYRQRNFKEEEKLGIILKGDYIRIVRE